MINYSRHRRAIEKTYEDRCTISRNVEAKKPNKETKLEMQVIYTGQPCRISQKALSSNDQTEAQNDIRYETKLFIAPELEILQGDVLLVTRVLGTARTYTAGEPFPYGSHQEISLQRKERA